jgi:S1-C subfamily serine protease
LIFFLEATLALKGETTMKKALLLCGLLLASAAPARAAPEDAVVKVFATVRYPNPLKPWTNGTSVEVAGSGTVIEGKKILTNAHLVLYATEVQIQLRRGGARVDATPDVVAPDMDLAVLSVADPKLLAKLTPLARAKKMPKVQDAVVIYGYPIGGDDLSVTKGVVSRIGFDRYSARGMGLIVQVSAAINPGNSGGAVVVGDRMVGLVFSRVRGAESIGCFIPNEEIELFLKDSKGGRYRGKPVEAAGTEFQRCENKALRRYLKLGDDGQGVLVVPPRHRPADYPFQDFDLLTRIGPHEIDNEGMVHLPDDLRLPFFSLLSRLARGNAVPVTLIRQGKRVEASLPITYEDNRLVGSYRGEKPSYFIHGPLVFAAAKTGAYSSYAQLQPNLDGVQSPLATRLTDRVRFPGEELVVVTSPMFTHKIAKGYGDPAGQVVKEINGTRVKNLKHLVELLRDSTDEYLVFRFAELGAEVLVFRRQEMNAATDDVLDDHGISPTRRGSPDLLKVWKQRKGR